VAGVGKETESEAGLSQGDEEPVVVLDVAARRTLQQGRQLVHDAPPDLGRLLEPRAGRGRMPFLRGKQIEHEGGVDGGVSAVVDNPELEPPCVELGGPLEVAQLSGEYPS